MAWTTWDLGAVKDCTNSYLDQPQVNRTVDEVAISIGENVTEGGALGVMDITNSQRTLNYTRILANPEYSTGPPISGALNGRYVTGTGGTPTEM
ncbi:hypothetical protein CPB86DRAFT_820452 [Serendipita vermifera]|nr:hypothetical protein CPB86DRAFT_820452 [Serendipita vermifera]